MATNIGSITFDVVLRTKDGESEHVVGELEIPISINLAKSGMAMRVMNATEGLTVNGSAVLR